MLIRIIVRICIVIYSRLSRAKYCSWYYRGRTILDSTHAHFVALFKKMHCPRAVSPVAVCRKDEDRVHVSVPMPVPMPVSVHMPVRRRDAAVRRPRRQGWGWRSRGVRLWYTTTLLAHSGCHRKLNAFWLALPPGGGQVGYVDRVPARPLQPLRRHSTNQVVAAVAARGPTPIAPAPSPSSRRRPATASYQTPRRAVAASPRALRCLGPAAASLVPNAQHHRVRAQWQERLRHPAATHSCGGTPLRRRAIRVVVSLFEV
jgi:hypothetical protein